MNRLVVLLCVGALIAACSSDKKEPAAAPASSSPSSSDVFVVVEQLVVIVVVSGPGTAGAAWLTWGGDSTRSGVTNDGPSANGLRRVWTSEKLDGDVYGEPLVVGDTVIVATSGNSVYAFDAATGKTKWQQLQLGPPVDGSTLPCGNVNPVGITSTPVADPVGNRLYVVGMMQPNHHELVALDLRTGAVLFRTRVDAAGADPNVHNQRGALAFANGRVYIPYGGRFGDCGNYKGRIVSVAADGSGPAVEYAVRANREGGFWGPTGPVVGPDGSLYVTSGNSDSRRDFDDGNAVIHLSPALQATDEFAPSNWAQLNAGDVGSRHGHARPARRRPHLPDREVRRRVRAECHAVGRRRWRDAPGEGVRSGIRGPRAPRDDGDRAVLEPAAVAHRRGQQPHRELVGGVPVARSTDHRQRTGLGAERQRWATARARRRVRSRRSSRPTSAR